MSLKGSARLFEAYLNLEHQTSLTLNSLYSSSVPFLKPAYSQS